MKEFFNMGGYALYVWGSFGMTALLMILEPMLIKNRRKSTIQRVSRIVRSKSAQSPRGNTGVNKNSSGIN